MAGVDHEEANRHLPEIVREAHERFPDIDIRMGSLAEHLDCVRRHARSLGEYRGELRFGAVAYVLQQVYSARIYLKQRNAFCQTMLERYAEPLTAFAGILGAESRQAFVDLAWRELLKNHPHDDICGCSVDRVHREMEGRFDRVEQIGEVLIRDALRFLADRVETPEDGAAPLFVVNPNGRPYRGTLVGTLAVPASRGSLGAFAIRDERGNVVPHQVVGRRTEVVMEVNRPRRTQFVDVALSLPAIPACGYRTFFAGEAGELPATDLRVSASTVENEHLTVTVRPDGTVTILDRETGVTFEGLHAIEDAEDAGDEYTYAPAPQGRTLTGADAAVEIEPLPAGPVRAGYRIRYLLALPRALEPDRVRRAGETVPYAIATDVWLGAGQRRVDFVTRLHNPARDHRLRVLFPTPIESRSVHVDGHFDVIERAVARPEGQGWAEPPSPTAHQRAFVDVSDGTAGLAVFNRGLPEYEALRSGAGVGVALTLLRCVGWLSRGDLSTRPGSAGPEVATPEAQCLGEYEFHYAVAPHAGTWEAILHDAHAYNAPCTIITDRTTEGVLPSDVEEPAPIAWEPMPRPAGLEGLPPSASFVTLEPSELVLSALRQARGG
ncbi:MAG: hypothetical protein JOZ41_02120, partial [Chloroflexi bacterium]|nr:hypothetical protein [Chloroflexota bacterium]